MYNCTKKPVFVANRGKEGSQREIYLVQITISSTFLYGVYTCMSGDLIALGVWGVFVGAVITANSNNANCGIKCT